MWFILLVLKRLELYDDTDYREFVISVGGIVQKKEGSERFSLSFSNFIVKELLYQNLLTSLCVN